MRQIDSKTTRAELAAIITAKLESKGISCVLVGGSVVSLYSHEKYVSKDLDFISPATHREIVTAMSELGFKASGKDFHHPDIDYSVEFPAGPVALGNESPVEAEGTMEVNGTTIRMLSPTQSVMDVSRGFITSTIANVWTRRCSLRRRIPSISTS